MDQRGYSALPDDSSPDVTDDSSPEVPYERDSSPNDPINEGENKEKSKAESESGPVQLSEECLKNKDSQEKTDPDLSDQTAEANVKLEMDAPNENEPDPSSQKAEASVKSKVDPQKESESGSSSQMAEDSESMRVRVKVFTNSPLGSPTILNSEDSETTASGDSSASFGIPTTGLRNLLDPRSAFRRFYDWFNLAVPERLFRRGGIAVLLFAIAVLIIYGFYKLYQYITGHMRPRK